MEQTSLKSIPLPAELPAIPHASTNEKLIVGKLVTDLLAAGFTLSVDDGEEVTVERSTDPAAIFPALSSTDADRLLIHRANTSDKGRISWVYLVWGNDHDIVSDWVMHNDIDPIIERVNDYSETLR